MQNCNREGYGQIWAEAAAGVGFESLVEEGIAQILAEMVTGAPRCWFQTKNIPVLSNQCFDIVSHLSVCEYNMVLFSSTSILGQKNWWCTCQVATP